MFDHQSSFVHDPLKKDLPALEKAQAQIKALAGADEKDHLVFCSSRAEAINHLIFSTYLDVTRKQGKNHYLTSKIDEAPPIMAASRLQELGCSYQMVEPTEEGVITAEALAEQISPQTALVSLSMANVLTGVIQPHEEIYTLCNERGILLHLDATPLVGQMHIDFQADFLTVDRALLIKSEHQVAPLIVGADEGQALRGGELDVPALLAFGRRALQMRENCDQNAFELAGWRDRLEELLLYKCKARALFFEQQRLPNTSCMIFDGITTDLLCYRLALRKIRTCMGGGPLQKLENVLRACHIPAPECHSALSFALWEEVDLEEAARQIANEVEQLRTFSETL